MNEKAKGRWEFVAVCGGSVAEDLSRFCTSKSLEDFCGLIFCEILSEIVEIQNGKPHCWTCCHFRLFSPLYAGCSVRRVTAFRLEGQKVGDEPPFFCFSALNAIFYFQNLAHISWTLSAFELAKSDFELQLFSGSI